MKKNFMPIAAILLTSLFFAGCDWQIPQKVSVKTDATYELGLGDSLTESMASGGLLSDFDLAKTISESLNKEKEEKEKWEVHDYFPGKKHADLKQILIGKSVFDFKFDENGIVKDDDKEVIGDSESAGGDDSIVSLAAIDGLGNLGLSDELTIPIDYNEKISLGFNMSSIMDSAFDALGGDFGKNLKFRTVPIYLFAQIPEGDGSGWKQAKISGAISLFYGKKDEGSELSEHHFILGKGNTETGSFGFMENPELKTEKIKEGNDEKDVLTMSISDALDDDSVVKSDLAGVLNYSAGEDADLYMQVELKEITLPTSLISSGKPVDVSVYMYIDFQMNFRLDKKSTMEIIGGDESDDGASADSGESSNPIFDTMDGGYIKLTPKALTFDIEPDNPNGTLDIILEFGKAQIEIPIKDIGEQSEFPISPLDLDEMMSAMSSGASMGLSLAFPKGMVKIPRVLDFDADIIIGLKTGGAIEVYPNPMGGAL